ncbi:MAG: alpha/beta hydrolase [Alphaproteobacteria bacterium]|nr:alpha/beta hydrolase [Alphaproteobacteria bacterium]MBQ7285345.1 alpha/beta hydrolase [Alphaproteobacteria bacterium]
MAEVIFNGHAGRLEGRYHQSSNPAAPIALILHPHPQYGGTMNNKVVYTLFSVFQNLGFSVLRFNFRSVGRSQGNFEDGPGELSDATVALDWLQSVNPEARQCWIAGYSFGAWIGLQLLMRRPDINNFIAVSPPANEKDFSFLAPCPTSGLITQGESDEIVTPASVTALVKRLNTQRNVSVDYAMVEDADHMYNNHLVDLYKITGNYIIDAMKKKTPIKKRRGRRKKNDMEDIGDEETLLLETDDTADDFSDDADFSDEDEE